MELEEIRRYLSDNTFSLCDNKAENVYFTLSFGVASYPRDAKTVVELFRVADSALFRTKDLGKNSLQNLLQAIFRFNIYYNINSTKLGV